MGAISHRGVAERSDRSLAPRTAVRALGVIAALVAFALLPSSADALTSQVLQASASNTPGFADSHMNDGSPSWTWGAATGLGGLTVRSQKSGANYRMLLKWDISLIPLDASVKRGDLDLYMNASNTATRSWQVLRLTNSWVEGTSTGAACTTTGVTWNSRDCVAANNWTTAGGDYTATGAVTITGSGTNCTNKWISTCFGVWNIPTIVNAWLTGSGNYGVLIKDTVEGNAQGYAYWFSSKENSAANSPKLTVYYLRKAQNLTATAGNGKVILNWAMPGGTPDYKGTMIVGGSDLTSVTNFSPVDGTTYGSGYVCGGTLAACGVLLDDTTSCAGGTCTATLTTTLVTNGTAYYYKAFTRDTDTTYCGGGTGACYSGASAIVSAKPMTTVSPDPKWGYSTINGASFAPPGLDAGSPGMVVFGDSTSLHFVNASGTSAGTWVVAPFTATGSISKRPPVIPSAYTTTGVNVTYATSQDAASPANGYLDAVNTSTGARLAAWAGQGTFSGNGLLGGAAVWLQAAGNLTFQPGSVTTDVVFAGTRNTGAGSTTNNKVYAVNGNTGAVVWTFSPGNMDIISSTPYVDYSHSAIWVTSRSVGGTGQPSVWKLNAATGALFNGGVNSQDKWSLGDIDASPTPSGNGQYIYVGTVSGTLYAIPIGGGTAIACTPPSCGGSTGAGVIQGLPWPLWNGNPETIIFSRNSTVHSVSFNTSTAAFTTTNWTVTLSGTPTVSAPIDDGTGNNIYVGASDGKVHKLAVSSGLEQGTAVTVTASGTTVGDPAFDFTNNLIYVGAGDGHVYAVTPW